MHDYNGNNMVVGDKVKLARGSWEWTIKSEIAEWGEVLLECDETKIEIFRVPSQVHKVEYIRWVK